LLLERLPPTEEFMKNFAVEVLEYLLSPFFDDNDELLGIEIIDFSPFYFFISFSLFSFFTKDLLPLT
jgi:S-ribosylhomocysteine lyase LuxS involved in autoinducer biosynthesis